MRCVRVSVRRALLSVSIATILTVISLFSLLGELGQHDGHNEQRRRRLVEHNISINNDDDKIPPISPAVHVCSLYVTIVKSQVDMANRVYPDIFPKPKKVRAMFASSIWLEREQLYVSVVRIYTPRRHSVLYLTTHDHEWTERANTPFRVSNVTVTPCVLNIPFGRERRPESRRALFLSPTTGIPSWRERRSIGPEDPRLFFDEHGHLSVAFNMKLNNTRQRRMHIIDLHTGEISLLQLANSSEAETVVKEKNWGPLLVTTSVHRHQKQQQQPPAKLYFVRNMNGLQMVECGTERSSCRSVNKSVDAWQSSITPLMHNSSVSQFRVGPAFERWMPDYYFTFVYMHFASVNEVNAVYRPCLVVVHVPDGEAQRAETVYFSDMVDFWPWNKTRQARIMFATSIARIERASDTLNVLVLVNDWFNGVYRVNGVLRLVADVVDKHRHRKLQTSAYNRARLVLEQTERSLSGVSFNLTKRPN